MGIAAEGRRIMKMDVRYVARLARLELSDAEAAMFQGQLEEVLGYVDKIQQLDLTGVEPMSHACALTNAFRDDEVRPGLPIEPVMRNAPASGGDQFLVPRIME
jgi:aspartyl-tRNA(Asn)/glutamyl-tRNA(Gln) amidotransferase subunit C